MSFPGIRRARALLLLVLTGMVAWLGAWGYRRAQFLAANLGPLIVAELRESLHRDVRVGGLDYRVPGRLVLRRVSIGATAARGSPRVLTAATVTIRYDWHALVAGPDDLVASIRRIEINRPELAATRRANGTWDLADVFRDAEPRSGGRFRGVVEVLGGHVRVTDRAPRSGRVDPVPAALPPASRAPAPPTVTELEEVEGSVDLRDQPQVVLRVHARLAGGASGDAGAEGTFHTLTRDWFARVVVHGVDAPYWLDYLGVRPAVTVRAGRLDAELLATGRSGAAATVGPGRVLLRQAELAVPGLARPVQAAELDLTGGAELIRFSGRGSLATAPVEFSGYSSTQGDTRFAVQFRAEPVGLGPVLDVFPGEVTTTDLAVDGPLHLAGTVAGTGSEIRASGSVRADSARFRGLPLTNVAAEWRRAGEAVQVASFRAESCGGTLEGSGWIQPVEGERTLVLSCQANGVRIGTLREALSTTAAADSRLARQLSGQVSAEFIVRGPLEQLDAAGEIRLEDLRLGSVTIAAAHARWQYRAGALVLNGARAEDPLASSQLSGSVDANGNLDLDVRLVAPQLSGLMVQAGLPDCGGSGLLRGRVSGTWDQPRFAGDLRVQGARWGDQRVDNLDARVVLQGEKFICRDVRAMILPATLQAPEVVIEPGEGGEYRVHGAGSVGRLTLAQCFRLAGAGQMLETEPVLGSATATFELDGRLAAPRVAVEVRALGVAGRGLRLGSVQARMEADPERRTIRILDAAADDGDQHLRLAGRIGLASGPEASPSLALTVSGENVWAIPFARRVFPALDRYADVGGRIAKVEASITGTAAEPACQGTLTTSVLSLNGLSFRPGSCRFGWRPQGLVVNDLELRAEGSAAGIRVPALAWIAGAADAGSGAPGQLAGEVILAGLSLEQLQRVLGDSPFAGSEAGSSLREALAEIPASAAGEMELRLRCPAAGPITAGLSAAEWATLAAQRRDHPTVAAELHVPDLSLAALPAEEVGGDREVRRIHLAVSLRALLEPDRWILDDLRIDQREGDALVTATGWWDTGPAPQAGRQMQLELSAVNIPLTAVARLPIPEVQRYLRPFRPLHGIAEIHAVATGAAESPNVQMSASVDRPMIAGLEFSELNADQVELAADTGELRLLDVDFVQHHEGHTHRIRLAGTLPFSWSLPGIVPDRKRDLTIRLPEQSLDILNDLGMPGPRPAAALALRLWEPPPEGGRKADDAGQWELHARLQQLRKALASLDVTDGTVEASLTLGGTADAPENRGFIALNGGRMRLGGGDTAIEDLNARMTFQGNEVRVERLTGDSNRSGGFEVTGGARLGREVTGGPAADLDLALYVRQFRFIEEHLDRVSTSLRGIAARGTLQTVDREGGREAAPIRITGPWTHPRISGAVRLSQATGGLPTSFPEAAPESPRLVDADLDLRLFLGENVAVRNPFLDMRLGSSLSVTNTLAAPVINGRITVERGTLQLPTMRFRVEGFIRVAYDGRRDLTEQASGGPIRVDLRGVTHLAVRESPGALPEDVEIVLNIRGSPMGDGSPAGSRSSLRPSLPGQLLVGAAPDGLSVELQSNPPLPSQQLSFLIRQQLGLEGINAGEGNLQAVLQNQVQLALANTVAPLLTSRIEDYVQQTLGLDTFTIEVGGLEQPLQLRAGKRIYGDFFGTFTQRFGAPVDSTRSLELYYRLTPQLRFGIRQDDPLERRYLFLSGSLRFR